MSSPYGNLTIGGYSESHLLKQAKKVFEKKSSETPIFDLDAENRIPKFESDELFIGKLLGRGGFCKVSEVIKVTLKDGVAEQIHPNSEQKDEHQFASILQDRNFMQARYLRSGTDYRYAIKMLRDDAVNDEQTFINGIVDLAIEARFLSVIRHPKYVLVVVHSASVSSKHADLFLCFPYQHHQNESLLFWDSVLARFFHRVGPSVRYFITNICGMDKAEGIGNP